MRDLTKTRTVLRRNNGWPEGSGKAVFTAEPEDHEGARGTRVVLDDDLYVDMSRPATITVTIEPGDLLNAPIGGEPGTPERAFNEAEGDRSE